MRERKGLKRSHPQLAVQVRHRALNLSGVKNVVCRDLSGVRKLSGPKNFRKIRVLSFPFSLYLSVPIYSKCNLPKVRVCVPPTKILIDQCPSVPWGMGGGVKGQCSLTHMNCYMAVCFLWMFSQQLGCCSQASYNFLGFMSLQQSLKTEGPFS